MKRLTINALIARAGRQCAATPVAPPEPSADDSRSTGGSVGKMACKPGLASATLRDGAGNIQMKRA